MRGKNKLDFLASEICEHILAAAWGDLEWKTICQLFTRCFPGSYCALINQNFQRPEFNFGEFDGLEGDHFNSFVNYFSSVNPWQNFWENAKNGTIIVSQRDDPASLYNQTEFYNDWMQKVGDYDAAVGLRIGASGEETLYLPVHYSVRHSENYDREAEYLMQRIRPALQTALRLTQKLRDAGEMQIALAALFNRQNEIALVVNNNMQLQNANQRAIYEIEMGDILKVKDNFLQLVDSSANKRLCLACSGSILNSSSHSGRFIFKSELRRFVVEVSPLPGATAGGLLAIRPQFLVEMQELDVSRHLPSRELLMEGLDFTMREADLCQKLIETQSLQQACSIIGISYENGRQKLKTIFQKTATNSQSQLLLMLSKL